MHILFNCSYLYLLEWIVNFTVFNCSYLSKIQKIKIQKTKIIIFEKDFILFIEVGLLHWIKDKIRNLAHKIRRPFFLFAGRSLNSGGRFSNSAGRFSYSLAIFLRIFWEFMNCLYKIRRRYRYWHRLLTFRHLL